MSQSVWAADNPIAAPVAEVSEWCKAEERLPLEGIWKYSFRAFHQDGGRVQQDDFYRLFLEYHKQEGTYVLGCVVQGVVHCPWTKTTLRPTEIEDRFKVKIQYARPSGSGFQNNVASAEARLVGGNRIEYSYLQPQAFDTTYEDIFGYFDRQGFRVGVGRFAHFDVVLEKVCGATPSKEKGPSQGTGFLVAAEGFIITNNHVVGDGKSIHIRGINGDYGAEQPAKVVAVDVSNDLALLKVDVANSPLATPRYGIQTKPLSVGESVFTLGYPLTGSMGREIKLTEGVVSSQTGFKGDVSLYQVSAPVQPGNSGGPLFGPCGNVVGVTSSKHKLAENATYAVKSLMVKNLLDTAGVSVPTLNNSKCGAESLADKVRRVKDTVLIVEVE
jgi:S1-C subfamily serine protease